MIFLGRFFHSVFNLLFLCYLFFSIYDAEVTFSGAGDDLRADYDNESLISVSLVNQSLAQRDTAINTAKDLFFYTAKGVVDTYESITQKDSSLVDAFLKQDPDYNQFDANMRGT